MANDGKFLNLTNGVPSQESATATSAGVGDANKIAKLDATGKFDASLFPAGLAPESRSVVASEALSAGNLVNLHNNGGTINMRKADATTPGKEAHGFVLAAVSNGVSGTVNLEEGVIAGLSGMTPGARQFLGVTAGLRQETAPSTAGQISQEVGYALSATEMMFRPRYAITLA
jgi:hypothetical protein